MKSLSALGLVLASLVTVVAACDEASTTATETSPDGGAAEDGGVVVADAAAETRDAGEDAGTALPEPPVTGNRAAIFVTSDVTTARSEHTAGAAFFTRTAADQSFTRKTIGPCLVDTYGSGAGPKDADRSAGKITISGGTKSVALLPEADGTYTTVSGQGALFAGGETLTITAQGAAVPAFVLTLTAPSKLTLSAPSLPATGALKVSRSAGVTASWTGTSAGVVVVYLDAAGGSSAHAATCSFPASSGSGVVPAAALADFPAVAGTYSIYAKTVAVQTPADGYLRATASTLLVGATGAGAAGDAQFE